MAKKDNNKKNEEKSLNDLIIDEAVNQYKEGKIKNYADVTKFLDKLYQPLMQTLLDAELENHLEYSKYEHTKNKEKANSNARNGHCKPKKDSKKS